ncbi:MAG: PAS domain-containing protein [Allosphingosinicella sp.]|uniref:PAS domain-containing protein n=1 Tax=Allosphingosinicella sp. TaxID=2823234 RepID=UPI0039515D29
MAVPYAQAEQVLSEALAALDGPHDQLSDRLEALPVPVYVADRDGVITHFNRACIDFAGREPVAGKDRWCVTWKLFHEDGAPMPHEHCPMAVTIRERREVRGLRAIAERPDGMRRAFEPFPTPVYDADGSFAGAVNLFVELGANKRVTELEQQARKCRRLAAGISDEPTIARLNLMADQYESEARRLREEG